MVHIFQKLQVKFTKRSRIFLPYKVFTHSPFHPFIRNSFQVKGMKHIFLTDSMTKKLYFCSCFMFLFIQARNL